jgi:hypothetical protein
MRTSAYWIVQQPLATGPDVRQRRHGGHSTHGHPEAARAWSDTRNAWMAEKFNQNGWTAKQSDVDAALWIVTAPVTGNTILMVIYTDDCDGPEVTELEQIKEAFHDCFGVTDADPAFMLGVKRDMSKRRNTSVYGTAPPIRFMN